METANLSYDKQTNVVYIDVTRDKLLPGYLRYLLEYIGINPFDTSIVFADNPQAYKIYLRGRGGYVWQEV